MRRDIEPGHVVVTADRADVEISEVNRAMASEVRFSRPSITTTRSPPRCATSAASVSLACKPNKMRPGSGSYMTGAGSAHQCVLP